MQEYKRTSPSSDELVDLHISVVPIEYWMEKLNYASQKVIADTFSAGFIRVHPGKTISLLRKDIVEQIGTEFLPPNYVFLKHVGRCLALVREKQEHHLKVKNFIPPQSSIPEMFVLPARPSMYSQAVLPSIKPNLTEVTGTSREKESPTTLLSSSQRPSMTSSHYDPSSLTQTSSSRASEKQANNLPNRGSSGTPSELARLVTGNSTAGPLNSAQKQIAKSNRDALPKPAPKAGLPPVTSRQADYAGQKRKSMSDQDTSPTSGGSVKKSHRSKPSHHGGTKSQKLQHSTPSQPSMDSDPTVAARPKSTTRRNHSQSNREQSSGSTFAEDVSENRQMQHDRNGHEHGAHYSLHSTDASASERNLNGNGEAASMQIVQERRPIQTSDSDSRPTPNSIRHVNPPSDMPQKARLWHELQRVKERRHQFERERQSLVRKAKAVAMQVNQQRHSATPNPKSSFKAPKGASKGGGEQCPVPSCYYMIQTLPDKKRHFSLVHRAMYLADKDKESVESKQWKENVIRSGSQKFNELLVHERRRNSRRNSQLEASGRGDTLRRRKKQQF